MCFEIKTHLAFYATVPPPFLFLLGDRTGVTGLLYGHVVRAWDGTSYSPAHQPIGGEYCNELGVQGQSAVTGG